MQINVFKIRNISTKHILKYKIQKTLNKVELRERKTGTSVYQPRLGLAIS